MEKGGINFLLFCFDLFVYFSIKKLRLHLFWLKMKFGNHFPENNVFGWHGKFGQTENIFSLTEN